MDRSIFLINWVFINATSNYKNIDKSCYVGSLSYRFGTLGMVSKEEQGVLSGRVRVQEHHLCA